MPTRIGDNQAAAAEAARRRQEAVEQARKQKEAAERRERQEAEQARQARERTQGSSNPFDERHGLDLGFAKGLFQSRFLGDNALTAQNNRSAPSSPHDSSIPPAERILRSSTDDPANASETLRGELEGRKSSRERQALLNDSRVVKALENIGRELSPERLNENSDRTQDETVARRTLTSLSRASELVDAEGRKLIATSFARGLSELPETRAFSEGRTSSEFYGHEKSFGNSLDASIKNGAGASFAVNLSMALERAGKPLLSMAVADVADTAFRDLREDFADKSRKAEELDNKLASWVSGFNPLFADTAQRGSGIDKGIEFFKKEHAKEYREFAEAGRKLETTLTGAHDAVRNASEMPRDFLTGDVLMLEESKKIYEQIPRMGETRAGAQSLGDALEKQAAHKPSYLDAIPGLFKDINAGDKYAKQFTGTLTKALGLRVVYLVSHKRDKDAARLVLNLNRYQRFLGIPEGQLKRITSEMRELLVAKNNPLLNPKLNRAESLETINRYFRKMSVGTPALNPDGHGAQALKGLTLVISLAGNMDKWSEFKDADLAERVRTAGDALQLGVDGGSLALKVFGEDGRRASSAVGLLDKAGARLGALGAVLDGISTVKAFSEHRYAEGALAGAGFAGSTILAIHALRTTALAAQGVPIAGQLAGVALVAVSELGRYALAKRDEHRDEKELKGFLQASGLNPDVAKPLSDLTSDRINMGTFLTQLAPHLQVSPRALLDHLVELSQTDKDVLKNIVEMAHDIDVDDQQKFKELGSNDSEAGERKTDLLHWPFKYEVKPDSLAGAANWMREKGYAPLIAFEQTTDRV